MKPSLAIIDTNVLVSGFLTLNAESPTARITDGMVQGAFPFVISVELLGEYRAVLLRPAIRQRHRLDSGAVDIVLEDIAANAILREPMASPHDAPDRGDQHLWNLLSAVPQAVLVTGDKLLLAQPPAEARVISPAAFIDLMTVG